MSMQKIFRAGLIGATLAIAALGHAGADTLTVEAGAPSNALNVPMNRAVVLKSDTSFSELSVANPGIADISTLSDKTIYVLGKAPGRTTLTLLGPDGKLITNVEVRVTPDIAELKQRLKEILPNEHIDVRTANDGIVLSGTVSSTQKLDRALELAKRYAPKRVSNLMTVGGTQQVMLQVRFTEMQRSVEKSLSSSLAINGGTGGGVGLKGGTNQFKTGSAISNVFNGGNANIANSTQGQITLGFSAGSLQFAVLLEALESKGVVRTLAEPNLTALSGQQAKFLAGGEYPIPVVDSNGNVTVQYKPFGVSLNFTPTVVDNNTINLQINAEVSGIDTTVSYNNNGFTINAFKTRQTSTTVEMHDGQSFAIAGLLQDNFNNSISQVPWLGDIPVLGALFRSADFQRQQSELVIIVTPHLVSPTNGVALEQPTDRITLPSERGMFLYGNVVGKKPSGRAGEVAKQDFSGPYGYSMN
ncbi:type II and III secretion system protein family protein [Solirhodobacter olei]|uniref:type II and III secretion system protein family protein n=1 Tax=Solirhodobacter olei TaxID=2493082 RepID=UPI000FD98B1B|nr:type II and III secretion system protein family protein [Solirhodobacter olei]